MGALLSVEELRVDYEDVTAVDDVSFAVEAGMVYGLIGPNGAGKTSIIRVIATLLEPTYGTVLVGGVNAVDHPLKALPRLGFMPDFPPLYDDLTVREFLELFASAYGLPQSQRRDRIDTLLEQVQLTMKADSPAGALSRGMKQRLFLAKTLLHDPDVLLLDEPASGLDPRARMDLRDVIVGLGQQGKAVVVSSHILSEMADFCNSVGIMEQGRMVVTGRIQDILKRLRPRRTLSLKLLGADDRVGDFLALQPGVVAVKVDGPRAGFEHEGGPDELAALLRELIKNSFDVVDFHEREGNLQDIFLEVSTGRVA
jgi:ABC-2 type transport system ATP-binding protein